MYLLLRRVPIVHGGKTFFKITVMYGRPSGEQDRNSGNLDDGTPADVKQTIAEAIQRRPPNALTELLAEIWSFVPTCEQEARRVMLPRWRILYGVDIDVLQKQVWSDSGRVTLLGDAVHAMGFYIGQGKNQCGKN
jgi:2-polyprenyl-6-methoxyphenol hydroxylase-like FAD-dependent oxidoreductase